MAKIKKHKTVLRKRFTFDTPNYEAEEKFNLKGLFPSKKIVSTTFSWVLNNLGEFKLGDHAAKRMEEKKTSNRPIKEILEDGEVVELRFGRYSHSLRAAIVRVHGLTTDDVYVLSFAEDLKTGKVNVNMLTTWRNRRDDVHSTLKTEDFCRKPIWATVDEAF